ncbi:MAG TPA: EamA family transporter [Mycobacteriales bacterium]|nr:EamA family transporter [Mycobacteriales bacterium]
MRTPAGPAAVPTTSPAAAVGAVLLAAVLFGTTGTAQALGPDATTPLGVGAVRLLVGGLALLAVLPLLGHRVRDAVALWRTPAGLGAGAFTALYQVSFFAGVERAGVALGTLAAIGSGPVLAGLLARFLLGERPGRAWAAATALCLVGLTLLVLEGGSGDADVVGVLLALIAGLGYAAYTVLAKSMMGRGAASAPVMAAAFGLGGLLLAPVLLLQPTAWLATPGGLVTALYLGLVTTTLAYVLFGRGLAVLPAGPVTTLVLAEPVVATALGTTVLGERLGLAGALGAGLVLVGLLVQGRGSSRRRPVASSS